MTAPDASPAMSLLGLIRSDLRALALVKGSQRTGLSSAIDVLTLPGAWAGILIRVGNSLHEHHVRPLSRICYFLNTVLFSCEVQPGVKIGPGMAVAHPVAVGIAKGVVIGANVRLMALVRIGGIATDDKDLDGFPTIGDDCWLLDGAKLFGPIELADRTVVAAGATVTKSFLEPDTILVGSPARVGKVRTDLPQ